jgi:hypothetical protein
LEKLMGWCGGTGAGGWGERVVRVVEEGVEWKCLQRVLLRKFNQKKVLESYTHSGFKVFMI